MFQRAMALVSLLLQQFAQASCWYNQCHGIHNHNYLPQHNAHTEFQNSPLIQVITVDGHTGAHRYTRGRNDAISLYKLL
jgi:hypothetical protein